MAIATLLGPYRAIEVLLRKYSFKLLYEFLNSSHLAPFHVEGIKPEFVMCDNMQQ